MATKKIAENVSSISVVRPDDWREEYGLGNLALGQINTAPGDVQGNLSKILTVYQQACQACVDLVVFPELSVMGYPIGDVITRYPALVTHQLRAIEQFAKKTNDTAALIGFVEPVLNLTLSDVKKPYYNAVAVCQHGKIQGVIRKHLLPAYHEYYDHRTFRSSPSMAVDRWRHDPFGIPDEPWDGKIGGHHYGVAVCYDWWYQPDNNPRQLNPVSEWLAHYPKTEVLINCSASPSRTGKQSIRQALFERLIRAYGKPLVYANTVGAIDAHSYDGASIVMGSTGRLIARGPSFEEAVILANPLTGAGVVCPTPEVIIEGVDFAGVEVGEPVFDASHSDDLERTYYSVVQGIRDYFKKCGFQRAVLGLSGGLDSSVTAVLAVAALGGDNVLGVAMPSELTSSESTEDARELAKRLGMPFIVSPIAEEVSALQNSLGGLQHHDGLKKTWGEPVDGSFAADNMQAMSRATLLRLLGNEYRALPLATSDKSEMYMGYATVNGDMSGALAPLGDIPKTKVRALARWLNEKASNKKREVSSERIKSCGDRFGMPWNEPPVPDVVIEKPSGAELAIDPSTGKTLTAEDALMPYEFADEIIWRLERFHQSKSTMMSETFVYEKDYQISGEKKKEWLDRFFVRMSRAVFKWHVAPPMIIVSGSGSISSSDYRHPITASRIVWDETYRG